MQNAPAGQPERRAGHGWPRAPRAASSPSPRACLGGPRPPQSVEPPPTRQGVISARAARRIRSRKTHLVLVFARRARGRARRESSVDSATLLASAACLEVRLLQLPLRVFAAAFRARARLTPRIALGAQDRLRPHRGTLHLKQSVGRVPPSTARLLQPTRDTCAHRSSRLARVDRRRRVCASPRATAGCPYCSFRSCDSPSGLL